MLCLWQKNARKLPSAWFYPDPINHLLLALHYSMLEMHMPDYASRRRMRLHMKECCRKSRWFEYTEDYYWQERRAAWEARWRK